MALYVLQLVLFYLFSGPTLLLGLSRWTILYPLITAKDKSSKDDATYAQLHLSILETLADSKKGVFSHDIFLEIIIFFFRKKQGGLENLNCGYVCSFIHR